MAAVESLAIGPDESGGGQSGPKATPSPFDEMKRERPQGTKAEPPSETASPSS